MNQIEHTFPLPETATHLLDEVEEALEHQPFYLKAQDFTRANPWTIIMAAAGLGLFLGFCSARRLN